MGSWADMIKNSPAGASQLGGSTLKNAQEVESPQDGQSQAAEQPANAKVESSGNSDQDVINGDATLGAKSTDRAPAGMTADDIAKLDGGLEGNTGDQTLKGKGADGINGSKDVQSVVAGQVQGGLSGSDADQAWQKLEVEEEAKNAPQADGKQASANVRHNGNLSGLQPNGEVASNSDLAFLQNEAKGQKTKGGSSDKMNDNDGETSGAQQVGKQIIDGAAKVDAWLTDHVLSKVPGIGKPLALVAKALEPLVTDGMNALGDAVDGDPDGAAQTIKGVGKDLLTGLK
jgi:hypothetical protein